KFARASQRGWEWVVKNPEEAIQIVMKQVRINHIATNATLQRLMLEEILDLMEDYETGQREYQLKEEMFDQAVLILLRGEVISKEHNIKELLP
ncbi:MAG: ABC transporter substrate-binding protein, partial [Spirochaetia bacterium]|nr:ABC transporter substrate-binding protein [Spirochaetia bacterium]